MKGNWGLYPDVGRRLTQVSGSRDYTRRSRLPGSSLWSGSEPAFNPGLPALVHEHSSARAAERCLLKWWYLYHVQLSFIKKLFYMRQWVKYLVCAILSNLRNSRYVLLGSLQPAWKPGSKKLKSVQSHIARVREPGSNQFDLVPGQWAINSAALILPRGWIKTACVQAFGNSTSYRRARDGLLSQGE